MTYLRFKSMLFIETPLFMKRAAALLDDDQLASLQITLMIHPDAGTPVASGLSKIRVPASGHGKRGGARVVYFWQTGADRIYLIYVFAKAERANLTKKQLKILRDLIEC